MTAPISTRIEINAPPALVREKFLDFPSLPLYHTAFIKSLSSASSTLAPGTVLRVQIDNMTLAPTIVENSPRAFIWRGSFLGIFNGEHAFRFEEAEGGRKTLFVHEERFDGILAWMIGEGTVASWVGFRAKTVNQFERFNGDFRTWCEKGTEGK